MFQLTAAKKAEVVANCDHLQTLTFSKALPFWFTEYGAVALANVLASSQAVEMGIHVVTSDSLRSHIATLKTGRGQYRKYLPYVFTEHP